MPETEKLAERFWVTRVASNVPWTLVSESTAKESIDHGWETYELVPVSASPAPDEEEWSAYHEFRKRTDPPPYGQGLDDEPAPPPAVGDDERAEKWARELIAAFEREPYRPLNVVNVAVSRWALRLAAALRRLRAAAEAVAAMPPAVVDSGAHERLRAELADPASADVDVDPRGDDWAYTEEPSAAATNAEAENERLRAALETVRRELDLPEHIAEIVGTALRGGSE